MSPLTRHEFIRCTFWIYSMNFNSCKPQLFLSLFFTTCAKGSSFPNIVWMLSCKKRGKKNLFHLFKCFWRRKKYKYSQAGLSESTFTGRRITFVLSSSKNCFTTFYQILNFHPHYKGECSTINHVPYSPLSSLPQCAQVSADSAFTSWEPQL